MPIYAANNEELFLDICIPDRWDEVTAIHIQMDAWLDTAQADATDTFRLQISYNSFTPGIDVVSDTFADVEAETTTGIAAQYQTYLLGFDIPVGTMKGDDLLAFRLRRIDKVVGTEITGEVIIEHMGIVFRCDKLGNPTYD